MRRNQRPGQYIYSYAYKSDEAWFTDEVAAANAGYAPYEEERLTQFLESDEVKEEIKKTARDVADAFLSSPKEDSVLVFPLLTDTHYVLNGNWEYTAATMEAVVKRLKDTDGITPDGYIHLGDLTDGMLSGKICAEYSHRVLDRICGWDRPVYLAVGNHDANYFRKNPDVMDESSQYALYLKGILDKNGRYGVSVQNNPGQLWYRVDLTEKKLTILVLSAYDNAEINRYGYSLSQIDWVSRQLSELPEDRRVLLLSHDAPLTHLDFWAKEIRNGDAMCDMLDEWNKSHDGRILGLLHGHTHADLVCYERTFPIISLCCSKIEYFEDKKPNGAIAPPRYEDEVTQESWDTLVLNTTSGTMDFLRFGAGIDRHIEGKVGQITEEPYVLAKKALVPQIWAHRGASGYAPENTLDAFLLAAELGAEGIELDVHYTKDRQIVVIHDERIDRTSNGSGRVADMTLEELRTYNYNKVHPEFSHCDIPTLRQVLELIRPTGMMINIELKTNVNFYPGLEREVMELVHEFAMDDRVIYSSFNHESVMRVRRMDADAKCGFLYNIGLTDVADYAKDHRIDALHPGVGCMKYPGFVESCKEKDIDINVWTVNTPSQMIQMQQYGVHAIITNYPDVARNLYYGEDKRKALDEFLQKHGPKPAEDLKEEPVSMSAPELKAERAPTPVSEPKAEPEPSLIEVSTAEPNTEPVNEPVSMAEPAPEMKQTGHPNALLHLAGSVYRYVRKPFVAIDRAVQKAAGKDVHE